MLRDVTPSGSGTQLILDDPQQRKPAVMETGGPPRVQEPEESG